MKSAQANAMDNFLQVERDAERLSVRNFPPSWLAGLAILGFYLLFAGVAGVSLWQLAPARLAQEGPWTVLPVAAFGVLMLWLALFAVSYQQIVLDRHGVHYARRVQGIAIWRRSLSLSSIQRASSGFRESASDTPDLHWLAIETRGRELRLTTNGNVDALCREFNQLLSQLRTLHPPADHPHGNASGIG